MPAVLRRGLLQGVGITLTGARAPDLERRLADLGATEGDQVLVHVAKQTPAQQALDEAWDAIRAHKLPPSPGTIVLIAPPPGDAHATATRAGYENLARTLSIEWARHGIRPVAILPAAHDDAPTAELVAYLASRAGAYFSGTAITLRLPTGPRPSPPSASPGPRRTRPARSPSG